MDLQPLVNYVDAKSKGSDRWQACCPCHDDKKPSLEIGIGNNGNVLVICRAGCTQDQLVDHFKAAGVWPASNNRTYEPTPIISFSKKPTQEVVNRLEEVWADAVHAGCDHQYLTEKGILSGHGCMRSENERALLLVDYRNADGELVAIQTINSCGTKKYVKGSKPKLGIHIVGDDDFPSKVALLNAATTIYIVEGLSTGVSIQNSVRECAVIVAGNVNQLAFPFEIFPRLRSRFIIAADNDGEDGGIGVRTAQEVSNTYQVPYTVPGLIDDKTDFNDIAVKLGASEVQRQLVENKIQPLSPMAWVQDFIVSDEEANAMSDPDYLVDELILQGHVVSFCGKPNSGKTTIVMELCRQMVKEHGVIVNYVNVDIGASDAKEEIIRAKQDNINLLLPDIVGGKSIADVTENLKRMALGGADLSNQVLVIDTLKKFGQMNNKAESANLYKLMRSLTGRNMTIILLTHTNKYDDADGNPVFEGTGDHRADVDELIFLIPDKQTDGSLLVALKPDKTRGIIEPRTMRIDEDRNVTLEDEYVDVGENVHRRKEQEKDSYTIEAINEALADGPLIQSEIGKVVCNSERTPKIGGNKFHNVLRHYSSNEQGATDSTLWVYQPTFQNNSKQYRMRNTDVLF